MADKTVRVVQIGAGGFGNYHLRCWKQIPDAEVIGIYDVDADAAQKTARQHGVETVYPNFETAISDARADAATIIVPNSLHADLSIRALQAGKHVFCEKPLAPTADEVAAMIVARDAAGKLLMAGQHMRFESRTQELKKLIDADYLGETYYARARWLRRRGAPTSAGFITKRLAALGPGADLGVHVVDLAMHLMGQPKPVAVSGISVCKLAHQPTLKNAWGAFDPATYDVEDFAAGWIRFENGAVLTVEVSWLLNMLDSETYGVELFGDRGGAAWPSARFVREDHGVLAEASIESFDRERGDGHVNEFKAFCDAIRTGGPSPVPAEESLVVARLLDALYASAASGVEVRLDS